MGTYTWTPSTTTTQGRIKVEATDSYGDKGSDISDSNFSVVSSCAIPSAPTLQGISAYGSSYTVSWTASSGATYYNLQQDTSSSFTNPSVVYTSNGTSWYSGDKLSGTYYYRVKAINNCGESGWSNTQSVVIQANQGPGAITAVSPADNSINQPLNLTLSWNATHSGGESLKYNIYVVHSDTTIFYPNNIQSYEQTGTTFTLSNLPYNTTISWGIEAIDSTGDRKYSSMFHFVTVGDATVPTGSVLINNGASSTTSYSVTLNLSAADSNSGVRYMRLSNDGTNWTYWIPNSSQYAWNLADYYYGGQSGLSTYTVYAKFRDYEGNESQVYSDTITKTTGTAGQILLNGKVYQNIQDAIDAATSGETVYLTEGMYQFAGSVIPTNHTDRTGGIQMKPGVTLKGAGAGKTTIDVSGYAFAAIIDADNSVIEGLTIINSNSLSWRYVVLLESDSSKIKNCILKGGASGVYVGWNATYSARNSEISNNTIINNSQSGIWLNSGSNISIFNNTIANNTQYGLFGFLASAKIINNIIANNGAGGYCGISSYEAFSTFQNNDVFSNYANYCGVSAQTGINGNISSNPSFVNTSVSDYHLNSGSPAIDAGSNVGIAYNGGAPDMGAYEYNGTGTIQVTSNRTDASFTIKGPSGTYSGSGMSWSMAGLPIGIYNATFAPITSRYTPSYQTTMLYSGQTLTFDGTYAADTVGPTGMIAVNFEEYATADSFVSVTFDIIDDVAGVGESSQMMFSNDGVTWSPAEPYSAIKKDWDLTFYGGNTTSGTKTVYAKVSDLFGNWSTLSDTIKYVPDRQVLEVPTQYSTIQSAIDAAQDGDMVYVLPGTYTEQITLNGGIRLQGSGAENTILDGNNTNINVNDNTIIDGFTITTNPSSGISSNASSIISNNTILGYAAIGNGNGNGRLIIRNNIIKVSAWGIYLGNNCSSCPPLSVDIENNIITGAAHGIDLIGSQLFKATVNLRNNIFYNNGTAINDRHSDTTRKHFFPSFNTYWNNTNNFAGNISAMGAGDINSDPLFVDSANANYQLQTNSPAFNSGNPEGKYNDPDGSRNDRGAYGGPSLNAPPKADFSISSLTAVPGTTFTFDAGLSHDGQSKDEKLKVRWNFDGNGTYDTNFTTDKITTRKYDTTATFNVALQVKDEKGYLSTATKAISVVSQSPNIPANSVPADTSTTGITPILSWSGGDPDSGDTVTYDVYFGTSSNPPLISSGQTETYFSPGTLEYSKTYYWQVVTTDNHGGASIGPLWYFITETLDIVPPTGTISINTGAAYTNSTSATLTLSCTDSGSGCAQMQFSNDNLTWSTAETYATSKAWTLSSGDGTKTVYAKFKDGAGNWSTIYSDTIVLDTAVPSTTASPATGIYATAQSVTLTCSDGTGSGCDKIYYTTDGTTPTTASTVYTAPITISSTTTLKFFAIDLLGNSETVKSVTYTIDTTAPTGTISINSGAASTNSTTTTLTLSCTDANGCAEMQFSNDNSTWSTAETYATSKAWTLSSGDGTKTVYAKFKDVAGNWSTAYSDTIVLDTTAPTTSTSPIGGTYNSTQIVTLTCSDGTGSGCDKIYYTTDGTPPTTASTVYSTAISISSTKTLKFFARDLAGNNETVKSEAYTIDTAAPTGTISINSGAASTNSTIATLTLSCTDTNGCAQMQFSNDNTTWSTAEAYATSKAWTLSSGDGTKTVYVKFKDNAGNWSTAYSDTIILDTADTTSPAFTSTSPAPNSYINSVTVGYTLSEAVASGKITFTRTGGSADSASHIYNFTDSDKTVGTHSVNTGLSLINAGIYTVTFEAADLAGNAATVVSNTGVVYDNTSASVVINSPSSNSRTNSVAVSYTLNEEITSCDIVFTRTGGTADGLSPRKRTLGASEKSSGGHTINTGLTLIDGAIYTVGFENVTDKAGNATASVSNTSITYDSTAVAITNTSPASNGIITKSTAGYTLSEAALSGKVTFTRSGGNADTGSSHVYTLSGSDLYPGSHTVNTNQSLVDGTFYTVTFEATDMAGNPATTVSNAMVFYDSNYGIGPVGNIDNISYSNKRVDGYDLIKLSISFRSKPGDANWNPVCDLDKSGIVDGSDLIMLGVHFGEVQ